MSTKAIGVSFPAVDEDDDKNVRMVVSADFIVGPSCIYLTVDHGGDVYSSYQIEAADARKGAHFILSETHPFDRSALETQLRLVEMLVERWDNQGAGYGSSGECARELRSVLRLES